MKKYMPLYLIQLCYAFSVAVLSLALIGTAHNNDGSVAVLMVFMALPSVLFSRVIGGLLDKHNKKKLLTFVVIFELLLILAMMWGGLLSYNIFIYIFAFLSFTATIFIDLMLRMSVTHFVQEKHYLKMNSAMSLIENIGVISGPILGGYFVYRNSVAGAFIVIAVLYAAILLAALLMKMPKIDSGHRTSHQDDSSSPKTPKKAGKRRIREVFCAVALFGFSISIINVAQIAFVMGRYNTNELGYGLTESAWGLGMAIGASMVLLLSKKLKPRSIFGYSYVIVGAAALLLFASHSFNFALLLFLVIGVGNITVAIVSTTLIQQMSSKNVLGKNLGVKAMIFQASALISMAFVGFLGGAISPPWLFVFAGAAFLLGGLTMLIFLMLSKSGQDC